MPRTSPEAIARGREKANARITEHRARVAAYKVRVQCADCPGEITWPACALHFDHLPGHEKFREISNMLSMAWERIVEEIHKTDVVCANHHAIRTQARRSS